MTHLADRNEQPKLYRWKAKAEEILAKIQRAREAQAKVAAGGQVVISMHFTNSRLATQESLQNVALRQ